jgi:ABC-2 type transport system ATP-binding protein
LIRVDTPARLRQQLYGHGVLIRLREISPAHISAIEALPFVSEVHRVDDSLSVKLDAPEENNPHLVRALVEVGADVQYVEETSHSLESVYFDLIAQTREDEP